MKLAMKRTMRYAAMQHATLRTTHRTLTCAARLFAPLALLALGACQSVTSLAPVGEQAATLNATEWEGAWYDPQTVMRLAVIDAAAGKLRLSYNDEGTPREMTLLLRTSGDWLIFNVLQNEVDDENAAEPGSDTRWYWGRVVNKGDRMMIWGPRAEAFVEAINNGQLPGKVVEDSAILDAMSPEQYRWITTDARRALMDWDAPLVLFRTLPREFQTVPVTEPEE